MATPNIIMLPRHEIAEDVGSLVVGESEVPKKRLTGDRGQRVFREKAAPSEIAGVGRAYGRPELLAHDRVSTVGADQKIARLAGIIVEMRGHRPCRKILIDPNKGFPLMVVLVAEGRLQRRVDQRPGRLGLRGKMLRLD